MPLRGSDEIRSGRWQRRLLWTLVGGFSLMMVLLLASGWMSLVAMRNLEQGTETLAERYVGQSDLMNQLQRHEANAGVLLLTMSKEAGGPRMADYLLSIQAEQEGTDQVISRALAQETEPQERRALLAVRESAGQLFAEMERLVGAGANDSPALSVNHRQFIASIADLMDTSFAGASAERSAELAKDRGLLDRSRSLVILSMTLAALCAIACMAASLLLFRHVQKRAEDLAKLSIHSLAQQEAAARRFSHDMHDEFGQTLNAIESTLAVIAPGNDDSRGRLADAIAMTKEAQANAREMSQLLRPRILDDLGLDAGLRELANAYSKRTGITVDYTSNWRQRLAPDVETHLFRIAQEALTNVSRHTLAKVVELSLLFTGGELALRISDNGGGMPAEQSRKTSLGLIGMAERARTIGAHIEIHSAVGKGVEVVVRLRGPDDTETGRSVPVRASSEV